MLNFQSAIRCVELSVIQKKPTRLEWTTNQNEEEITANSKKTQARYPGKH